MKWMRISKNVIISELNLKRYEEGRVKCLYCGKAFRKQEKIIKVKELLKHKRNKFCIGCIKPYIEESVLELDKFSKDTLQGMKDKSKDIMVILL